MPTSAPLTVTQNPPNPQPTGAPLPSLNPEPVNSTSSQVPSTGKQNPFNPATPTSSVFVTPEKTVTLSTAVPSPATDGPINPTTTETPAPVTSEGTTRFSTAVPFTATVVPVNPSTIIQKGPCPEGWELFDHFCYKSYPKKKYADAEADCQKQGAHLASVHNENENLFIAELGHKAHPENSCRRLEQMWIGLDRKNGDNFVWIDKTSNDYTNWGPLQPDNHGHKNESCTQINIAKDCDKVNQTERYTTTFEQGKWNDYLCNYKLAYVCKKASKNPEVTTPAHMPAERKIRSL
uniref:C-type lectin domain-containing protein n=1 Tax=Panagrolaimus davidi TaxID=227884 RepID=A0A914QQL9_9BILA